eukprot:6187057-Alexandrium_andersonii.AAC.1
MMKGLKVEPCSNFTVSTNRGLTHQTAPPLDAGVSSSRKRCMHEPVSSMAGASAYAQHACFAVQGLL